MLNSLFFLDWNKIFTHHQIRIHSLPSWSRWYFWDFKREKKPSIIVVIIQTIYTSLNQFIYSVVLHGLHEPDSNLQEAFFFHFLSQRYKQCELI